MRKLYRIIITVSLFSLSVYSNAANVLNSDWDDVARGRCDDQNVAWWSSAEAIRIAGNVLLYQKNCGGWYKNIYDQHRVLTENDKQTLLASKSANTNCTLDNGATYYELTYLARVYGAISNDTVKNEIAESFYKGIQYLIDAQYDNGGWPQFYPLRGGYYNQITYNDNAMLHAMEILKHIYLDDGTYPISVDDSLSVPAGEAYEKGLDCILATQYIQDGQLRVWCAQHQYNTLLPVIARSYELPSLSGQESGGVVRFLMGLDNPSKEIRRAVIAAVDWYDEVRIKDTRVEKYTNSDGLPDLRVVHDAGAPDLWARFYTLEDNIPFFCDRDGVKKYSLAEIGYERRNGYSWYVSEGYNVSDDYLSWIGTWGTTVVTGPATGHEFYTSDTLTVKAFANQYKGSSIKSFGYTIDGDENHSYSTARIDTTLSGLAAGSHSIIVKAEYDNGSTESDTSTFEVVVRTFSLIVNSGSGDGEYAEGSVVSIQADDPDPGYIFKGWIGDSAYIENTKEANTSLTMPGMKVSVRASYQNIVSTADAGSVTGLVCYPNPATEGMSVQLKNSSISVLEIYNIGGQKLFSRISGSEKYYLDTSSFKPGIYFISVVDPENFRYYQRIIIR